ncbi:MAG: proline-rich domain-containing protein [bacterium]|nr:proline-rich domain-containing protein [bacterium]
MADKIEINLSQGGQKPSNKPANPKGGSPKPTTAPTPKKEEPPPQKPTPVVTPKEGAKQPQKPAPTPSPAQTSPPSGESVKTETSSPPPKSGGEGGPAAAPRNWVVDVESGKPAPPKGQQEDTPARPQTLPKPTSPKLHRVFGGEQSSWQEKAKLIGKVLLLLALIAVFIGVVITVVSTPVRNRMSDMSNVVFGRPGTESPGVVGKVSEIGQTLNTLNETLGLIRSNAVTHAEMQTAISNSLHGFTVVSDGATNRVEGFVDKVESAMVNTISRLHNENVKEWSEELKTFQDRLMIQTEEKLVASSNQLSGEIAKLSSRISDMENRPAVTPNALSLLKEDIIGEVGEKLRDQDDRVNARLAEINLTIDAFVVKWGQEMKKQTASIPHTAVSDIPQDDNLKKLERLGALRITSEAVRGVAINPSYLSTNLAKAITYECPYERGGRTLFGNKFNIQIKVALRPLRANDVFEGEVVLIGAHIAEAAWVLVRKNYLDQNPKTADHVRFREEVGAIAGRYLANSPLQGKVAFVTATYLVEK